MKLLHVPFTYHPDACGGTEAYVTALCHALDPLGTRSTIAAPGVENARYEHEGLPVQRFPVHSTLDQDMMYSKGDPVAAEAFGRLLDQDRPDIVHFHAYSPAVSVLCLREAQRRGIPALTTYHTPTQSCLRGALMRWGTIPCDGGLRPGLCAACFLHDHGMPAPLARLSVLASQMTWPLAKLPGLPNSARAVLRSPALAAGFQEAVRTWWAGMHCIVALCDWTKKLLLLNEVPAERIRLVRHGLTHPVEPLSLSEPSSPPIRLAFLGRLDASKGIDLIIDALRLAPELPVTVDLHTISGNDGSSLSRELRARAKNDPRITFQPALPPADVVATLRSFHALLIPSRVQETGPLVMLDAFAAGIPVIGSAVGGLAEGVRDGVDGLLVPHPIPEAWRDTLRQVVTSPGLLSRLRAGVRQPRTQSQVASEMMAIYSSILKQN